MIDQIKEWIANNNLDVKWQDEVTFTLDRKDYLVILPKEGKVFDSEFNLMISDQESEKILIDFYCFSFGNQVYYTSIKEEKVTLNLLKYIGKAKDISGFSNLGIHGGFELCSGSKLYGEWCKKAKWLGIEALGLAEKHTLAGALKFQQACQKAGIKPIIGETVLVKGRNDNTKQEYEYKLKLYVANQFGWENLLKIHKNLNIDNSGQFVNEDVVFPNSGGLFAVLQNDTLLNDNIETLLQCNCFDKLYYQFDPVKYSSEKRDLEVLNCLKTYLKEYKGVLPLALITDSYYLDKEDSRVKKILAFIGKSEFQYQSQDQYFKTFEDVIEETVEMFSTAGEEFALAELENAVEGLEEIVNGCDFKIKTGEIYLPKYEMTEEENEKYEDNEELFWDAINTGLQEKVFSKKGKDEEKYIARIEREYDIISRGKFQDYFLIIRDIINWCEKNSIYVGTGRGSIGGSIIAYCMNITKVDALEYDLIFERFLNESRIGKGLPDVDTDFESRHRDKVIKYIEQRFGKHNVSAIGTYGVLKTKAAFRDLLRFNGEQPQIINYFAKIIEEKSGSHITSLYEEACRTEKLKEFFNNHFDSINDIPLILNQPKNASVHAAGIVITPAYKDIYEWFPCKIMDDMVVSEWEGPQLDECGFLKADILGLTQLDKLHDIVDLIKINANEEIDLNNINLKDNNVFDLFCKGLNQDVFQFGTDGLSSYCREVKPESILELAAINALYRPGAMDSGAHTDYVKIKFGKKEAEYDWGCEDITNTTMGLMVFQEQAIFIVQKVGGFSLTDGDGVRKATGKKDLEKMKSYKEKFVEGATKQGCPEYEAVKIWNKIEAFAGYSFNLSHAVAYSLIGYQTQWLKCHYPLEFWTISIQEASDEDVPKRISEMRKFEGINLEGPNINKSKSTFFTDFETNSIYWSFSRIKHVGDIATNAIVKEREDNGNFFSLEEFVTRTKGKSVNSRVVKHLILSGAFDELYNIKSPLERRKIIKEFEKLYNVKLDEFETKGAYKEFFWYKLQRNLSGFGFFEYENQLAELGYSGSDYITPESLQLSENEGIEGRVTGILTEVIKRKTKKGEMGKLTLDNNNELIDVVLWNDVWDVVRKDIEANEGCGIVISGKIQWDNYNKKNAFYSTDKTEIEIF